MVGKQNNMDSGFWSFFLKFNENSILIGLTEVTAPVIFQCGMMLMKFVDQNLKSNLILAVQKILH